MFSEVKEHYLRALEEARSEMVRLIQQRSEIDAKLSKLKHTVDALSALCEQPVSEPATPALTSAQIDDLGITDAIRKVLTDSKLPLTAPQIRDALVNLGIDVSQYASILTVIHNTIKRMTKQGEIREVKTSAGLFVGWLYCRSLPTLDGEPATFRVRSRRFRDVRDVAMDALGAIKEK
jgi:hypothetical protein